MWYDTLDQIATLWEPVDDAELRRRWDGFVARVRAETTPPYHLERIIAELDEIRGERPREAVAILDHGCGPGSSLIWLAALGYTNIKAVDVGGGDFAEQNRLSRLCWGKSEPVFIDYDGHRLPFADAQFDLIISQQVLEHVHDSALEAYYAEEGRVLRPGGRALHQVPHRLSPYDSHTNMWFVHFLPGAMPDRFMNLIGREWPDHLHLRWPWVHRRLVERHIGPCTNLSADRLQRLSNFSYYDGPVGLRRLMATACRVPLVGSAIAALTSHAVALETRTIRRSN